MGETIGFAGLGRMGSAMAKNLLDAGYDLRVWNRTRGKAPEGADEARTPRDLAEGPRIVITMLADDAAVESVVFGPDGIITGLREGGIHVGMSTISMALSQRLAEEHRHRRQKFVAAPVFGRPDAAAAKKLWIVPGGDGANDCAEIFAALGQGTFPMDSAPHASLAKLIGNFFLAMMIEGFGEAFALAEKAGLNPPTLADALTKIIFGGAPIPAGYAQRIAATTFEPAGFAMALGLKDVTLAQEAARSLNVSLPLASLARDHMLASLAKGRQGWDWGGAAAILRELAGLQPRR
jgi:3-hydroxyisobutyrate dehydrogenase-like beta-hydroxyacid dehydrogenase